MQHQTRIAGRCAWLREAIAPGEIDAPALEGEQRADVCIVGGGYAGMWTALEIKRRAPATDVAIVEADICGGGASGRNSGMVLSQWAKFAALENFCGTADAIRLGHLFGNSAGDLDAFCRAQGIEAEFRRDGWIWGASCERHVGSWNGILAALAKHNLAPFTPMSAEEIAARTGSRSFLAGIFDPTAATVHPGKLARGLRRVALQAGIRIYENSPMVRLESRPSPLVHTPAGRIAAQRVVLTLNAWSTLLPQLRPAILVIASDDAVTAPRPDLIERAGYKAKPLISDSQVFVTGFRTTGDHRLNAGVTGGIIGYGSLGGARFEGRSPREDAIRAALRRCHPTLADLPFADSWYGPIDRTRSGLPLFGALPRSPDIFYGYGFSGNGIATTPIAGRILASLALGQKDEWSGCGLVRPVERWLPPEPIRYIGAHLVRAAIRRQDALAHQGRMPGLLVRSLAALAPGGITSSRIARN
ncbi:NAD(P)/FAD-dependent oxidoreductase [Dongia deserti]|uniref:NAD(P)/FAD-dependent oxidoreductase n=1 Tax=Dongia deserti TaxID=2268030 RepID=UPI0013C43640|nr:FAD-binding oxidoreductase [Dongia deserti]